MSPTKEPGPKIGNGFSSFAYYISSVKGHGKVVEKGL